VITGSDDRLVKIWSMETALCLASCRGHEVSSAGGCLLSILIITIVLNPWHMFCLFKGDITDLAVSSNNALVASSSNDFIIRVVSFSLYNISLNVNIFIFYCLHLII
jgi:PH-interacting protein